MTWPPMSNKKPSGVKSVHARPPASGACKGVDHVIILYHNWADHLHNLLDNNENHICDSQCWTASNLFWEGILQIPKGKSRCWVVHQQTFMIPSLQLWSKGKQIWPSMERLKKPPSTGRGSWVLFATQLSDGEEIPSDDYKGSSVPWRLIKVCDDYRTRRWTSWRCSSTSQT